MDPLTILMDCSDALIKCESENSVRVAYLDWLDRLDNSGFWSPDTQNGLKIPWRSCREASQSGSLKPCFSKPGIYLFSNADGVPRYIGKAESQSLRKRLRGRYISGPKSQFELADTISKDKPIPEIVATDSFYRSRLRGARDLARQGIDGIWIGLLPIEDKEHVGQLEQSLIPVANAINVERGNEPLINKEFMAGGAN